MEDGFHSQIRPRISGKVLLVWKTAYAQALYLAHSYFIRRAIGDAVSQASFASAENSDTLGVVYYENAIVRASVKFFNDIVCVFDLELKFSPFDFDDDPTTPGGSAAATIRQLANAVSKPQMFKTLSYHYVISTGRRLQLRPLLESGDSLMGTARRNILLCDASDALVATRRLLGARLLVTHRVKIGNGGSGDSVPATGDDRVSRLLTARSECGLRARALASCRSVVATGLRSADLALVIGTVANNGIGEHVVRLVKSLFGQAAAILRRRQSVQLRRVSIGAEHGGTLAFG